MRDALKEENAKPQGNYWGKMRTKEQVFGTSLRKIRNSNYPLTSDKGKKFNRRVRSNSWIRMKYKLEIPLALKSRPGRHQKSCRCPQWEAPQGQTQETWEKGVDQHRNRFAISFLNAGLPAFVKCWMRPGLNYILPFDFHMPTTCLLLLTSRT